MQVYLAEVDEVDSFSLFAGTREKLGSMQSDDGESTEPEISDVNVTLNDGSVKPRSLGFQLNSQLK